MNFRARPAAIAQGTKRPHRAFLLEIRAFRGANDTNVGLTERLSCQRPAVTATLVAVFSNHLPGFQIWHSIFAK